MKPEFVRKLAAGKPNNFIVIGIARNFLELLLDDEGINQEQYNQFLGTCRSFHDTSFFYA